MLKRIKVYFIPPEAPEIAARFDSTANRVHDVLKEYRDCHRTLESNWQGNSANLYMELADPEARTLEDYARWLHQQADQIRSQKVYRWEWGSE